MMYSLAQLFAKKSGRDYNPLAASRDSSIANVPLDEADEERPLPVQR